MCTVPFATWGNIPTGLRDQGVPSLRGGIIQSVTAPTISLEPPGWSRASLAAQLVKNRPAMQKTPVRSPQIPLPDAAPLSPQRTPKTSALAHLSCLEPCLQKESGSFKSVLPSWCTPSHPVYNPVRGSTVFLNHRKFWLQHWFSCLVLSHSLHSPSVMPSPLLCVGYSTG